MAVDRKYGVESYAFIVITICLMFFFIWLSMTTVFHDYQKSYTMYSEYEQLCGVFGVTDIVVNNVSYTCADVLEACDVNITFANNVLTTNYDTTPLCEGIFWR